MVPKGLQVMLRYLAWVFDEVALVQYACQEGDEDVDRPIDLVCSVRKYTPGNFAEDT